MIINRVRDSILENDNKSLRLIVQRLYRPKQTSLIGLPFLADELFVGMNYKKESIDNNKKIWKYGDLCGWMREKWP